MIIPCKQCISLVLCIQRLKKWTEPGDFTSFSNLMTDCLTVLEYIYKLPGIDEQDRRDSINEVRELFRIPKLPRVYGDPFYYVVRIKKPGFNRLEYFARNDCNLFNLNRKMQRVECLSG
jgi:hypothetical protein